MQQHQPGWSLFKRALRGDYRAEHLRATCGGGGHVGLQLQTGARNYIYKFTLQATFFTSSVEWQWRLSARPRTQCNDPTRTLPAIHILQDPVTFSI